MATLHYENLHVHRPDMLIRMPVSALKIFYNFLTGTKQYVERIGTAKRPVWSPGQRPDCKHDGDDAAGSWLLPAEAEDRPCDPDWPRSKPSVATAGQLDTQDRAWRRRSARSREIAS